MSFPRDPQWVAKIAKLENFPTKTWTWLKSIPCGLWWSQHLCECIHSLTLFTCCHIAEQCHFVVQEPVVILKPQDFVKWLEGSSRLMCLYVYFVSTCSKREVATIFGFGSCMFPLLHLMLLIWEITTTGYSSGMGAIIKITQMQMIHKSKLILLSLHKKSRKLIYWGQCQNWKDLQEHLIWQFLSTDKET